MAVSRIARVLARATPLLVLAAGCTMAPAWTELFNGTDLDGWEITRFGGEGEVLVRDGELILGAGEALTGVTWNGSEPPRTNYEVELRATRSDGSDFFCGLTFPVRDDHCTLIVGGWGGSLVGLSSIDGLDASGNETGTSMTFVNGRAYRIRVRVEDHRIRAWVDDRLLVAADIRGRTIGIRDDVAPSRPFGIASYASTAAISFVRWRRLDRD